MQMIHVLAPEFLYSPCYLSFILIKSQLALLNGIRCIVKVRLSLKKLFIYELTVSPDLPNSCVPKSVVDFVGSWGLGAARSVSVNAV